MKTEHHIVILTAHMVIGGVSTCLIRLLDVLLRTGMYRVTVVLRDDLIHETYRNWLLKSGCKLVVLKSFIERKPKGFFLRHIWKLRRGVSRIKSSVVAWSIFKDAVFVLDYCNGFMWNFVKDRKIPNAFWFHGGSTEIERLIVSNKENLFSTFSSIIVLTNRLRNNMINLMPEIADRVTQIYNVIDESEIKKKAQTGTAPDTEKYFVFIARLAKDKDHKTVIEAFRLFADKNPDGVIYFIGDGNLRDKYEMMVRELGLEENIKFAGMMTNPYGYLKGAIAHILSSSGEGLPTVIVEAAALGVLNIASDCPDGPRELLMDGKAGLLYPPGDTHVLCKILDDVWNGRVKTDELIQRGIDGLSRFSENEIIPRIEKIIGV